MLSLRLLPKQYFWYVPVKLLWSCEVKLFCFFHADWKKFIISRRWQKILPPGKLVDLQESRKKVEKEEKERKRKHTDLWVKSLNKLYVLQKCN